MIEFYRKTKFLILLIDDEVSIPHYDRYLLQKEIQKLQEHNQIIIVVKFVVFIIINDYNISMIFS